MKFWKEFDKMIWNWGRFLMNLEVIERSQWDLTAAITMLRWNNRSIVMAAVRSFNDIYFYLKIYFIACCAVHFETWLSYLVEKFVIGSYVGQGSMEKSALIHYSSIGLIFFFIFCMHWNIFLGLKNKCNSRPSHHA